MEKYREIIDDWEAFKDACNSPCITTVRRNGLKASGEFEERLRSEFHNVEKAGWNDKIFKLIDEEKPGKSVLHWLGRYYVQEESATVPVEVLDPEPGEDVLDMAAAPGGKTTQIADKINNSGKLIANDVSDSRMRSLHSNIYRTGSSCVAAVNYDARHLPEDESYSKILLDAPCSGEGDRARRSFEPADETEVESLSNLQTQLIEKASRLLEKGGTLVYSTCTINPEENEQVIEEAVEKTELELEKIDLDLPHSRGVNSFENISFNGSMEKTVRIYPHHLNSGVIFIAKFGK